MKNRENCEREKKRKLLQRKSKYTSLVHHCRDHPHHTIYPIYTYLLNTYQVYTGVKRKEHAGRRRRFHLVNGLTIALTRVTSAYGVGHVNGGACEEVNAETGIREINEQRPVLSSG